MKLQNLIEVVLEHGNPKDFDDYDFILWSKTVYNHAKFQSKKLELGDFVPCDSEGNVLEFPEPVPETGHTDECYCDGCKSLFGNYDKALTAYTQAKAKVLFKDWEVIESGWDMDSIHVIIEHSSLRRTVFLDGEVNGESHIHHLCDLGLELTDYAVEEFGL